MLPLVSPRGKLLCSTRKMELTSYIVLNAVNYGDIDVSGLYRAYKKKSAFNFVCCTVTLIASWIE